MVVPATWLGSVELFYHFLFGYFMPIVNWQESTGAREFTVRDCGPMNPWFELLAPETDLEFMLPGVMLQRVLSHRQERQIMHTWDDPTKFHRKSMASFRSTILRRSGAQIQRPSTLLRPRITVLERRASHDFYLSRKSETFNSAASTRSIPNMGAVIDSLAEFGEITLLDTAGMPPAEQVRALAGTDLLVAQHGAGLSNMVWMPTGSAVLEIKPPLMPTVNEIYSNLASSCRLDHVAIAQTDDHALVDTANVRLAASRLLMNPGTYIPTMTGRLPLRILRQLPRRW